MSQGMPWYKREPAVTLHETMGMNAEEKGVYWVCMDLMYLYGGPIEDDPRHIAGACGISVRKWNLIKRRLAGLGKMTLQHGRVSIPSVTTAVAAWFARHPTSGGKVGKSSDNSRKVEIISAKQAPVSSDINNLGIETRAGKTRPDQSEVPIQREELSSGRVVVLYPGVRDGGDAA